VILSFSRNYASLFTVLNQTKWSKYVITGEVLIKPKLRVSYSSPIYQCHASGTSNPSLLFWPREGNTTMSHNNTFTTWCVEKTWGRFLIISLEYTHIKRNLIFIYNRLRLFLLNFLLTLFFCDFPTMGLWKFSWTIFRIFRG
jgi:hypothetical protein